MSPRTRRQPINPTKTSRNTNGTTQIRTNTQNTTTRRNKSPLATRTPTGDQVPIERVNALTKNMVIRVRHHHRLRKIGLHVKYSAQTTECSSDGFIGWCWVIGETYPSCIILV